MNRGLQMTKIEQKIIATIRSALDSYYMLGVESYMHDFACKDVDLSPRDTIIFSPTRITVLLDGKRIASIQLSNNVYYKDKTVADIFILLSGRSDKIVCSRINAIVAALFSKVEGESYHVETQQGVPMLLKQIPIVIDKCTTYKKYRLNKLLPYRLSVGYDLCYADTNQLVSPIATATY